jgi:hypothetical protein
MNENIQGKIIAEEGKYGANDRLRVSNSSIKRIPTEIKSSVERVPFEILALIFEEYVGMNFSAWNLTKVCRAWKRAALWTPALWGVLVITQDRDNWFTGQCSIDDDGNKNFNIGKRNVCLKEEQLQRCLRRCAGAPLDVLIRCITDDRELTNELVKCLKALMIPSNTARIIRLELYLPFQSVARAWPECFQDARLHNIETLSMDPRISSRWTEGLFNAMSKTTSPGQDDLESISPSTLPEEPWVNLRNFSISANPQEFNQIARRITQVTTIGHLPFGWPNRETPKVTFSHLVETNISANPFDFRRIHLPFLKKLVVWDGTARVFDEAAVPESCNLPKLIRFHIISQYLRQWFSNISIPNLEVLVLDSKKTQLNINPDVFKSTSLLTFTKTQELFLREFPNYKIAASILEALPNVTRLVIFDLESD